MEADELAQQIKEMAEGSQRKETRERWVAVYVGVLAMLMALTNLGGSNATKDMQSNAIRASDTWSFYQAKHLRETSYRIASAELMAEAEIGSGLSDDARGKLRDLAGGWKSTADRYESDPKTGEGRKELAAKAMDLERLRDRAAARDPNFDLAGAGLQIAVVLASVSLVSGVATLLWLSGALAVAGTVMMANGFTLLVSLPEL
ncbi:MAG: DUF4337 family protein [Azospirillum sp.]|nr:DUF4337 family protein [Azospirillum sp.]